MTFVPGTVAAGASFDWILLDAPPVGLMADAGLLARLGSLVRVDTHDPLLMAQVTQYGGAISLGREIGSLASGRRADVVIWSGDPLQVASNVETVFIDGVRQPLETRQTRLRDRYRDLDRRELPEAYRW